MQEECRLKEHINLYISRRVHYFHNCICVMSILLLQDLSFSRPVYIYYMVFTFFANSLKNLFQQTKIDLF